MEYIKRESYEIKDALDGDELPGIRRVGAYLTSMGSYLVKIGMAENIGWFYSVQGIVSLFMPALIGIIADRWMQGQKVLSLCHFLAGVFMLGASLYGFEAGAEASFSTLFTLYSLSVAFFMPTIALANSVAYSALEEPVWIR